LANLAKSGDAGLQLLTEKSNKKMALTPCQKAAVGAQYGLGDLALVDFEGQKYLSRSPKSVELTRRVLMANGLIHVETRAGAPIQAGENVLIPMAKSLRILIPGIPGGLIWNRPVAVVVRSAAGVEQVLPVRDVTRMALFSIWGVALAKLLFFWLVSKRKSKARKNKEVVE
jgi:hypothetical protein